MTTPHHLGKYEITECSAGRHGRGVQGIRSTGIRRTVAIKNHPQGTVEGERHAAALLARFRNEAQAAGKLAPDHRVIRCNVYDYGEDAAVAYIAMEYVEGNSLREYIGRGTRFARARRVSIMFAASGRGSRTRYERRVWHRTSSRATVIVMMERQGQDRRFRIARTRRRS